MSVDVLCMLFRPEAFKARMLARPFADGQFVSGKSDNNSSYSSSGGKRNDEQWGGGRSGGICVCRRPKWMVLEWGNEWRDGASITVSTTSINPSTFIISIAGWAQTSAFVAISIDSSIPSSPGSSRSQL